MRLRPLSEAECYIRCYGARREEQVSLVRVMSPSERGESVVGARLKALFDEHFDPDFAPEREAA